MPEQQPTADHFQSASAPERGARGGEQPNRSNTRTGWIDRIPAPARPYLRLMRLDRPIGIWLRLLPALWAIALASGGRPKPALIAIFVVEAVLSRGMGCTLNDIVDRHIDAQVARTRSRPLASNQISVRAAVVFFLLQIAIEALVLSTLGPVVLALFAATVVLAAVYPWLKRITFWPQAFLGIVYSSSVLMGWSAVTGGLGLASLLLYAGCAIWTLGYDTIYAHQDRVDDARIGVKSTAIYLGEASRRWVCGFYAVAVVLWGAALALQTSPGAAMIAMLVLAVSLAFQLWRWSPESPESCLAAFKSNQVIGWIGLAAIVLAGGRI